ncbi:MAG: hypothetical protein II816_00370 [Elusimicrobia bacterium]|nr:hypothetical protein [Elusimicrobiota bacterium]
MKKFLSILLVLTFITSSSYAIDLIPKLSICLPGTFRSDYEVDRALNIGVEARVPLDEHWVFGFGFDYLFNRRLGLGKKAKAEDFGKDQYYSSKQFSMLPVFISIMVYPFGSFGEYKPYLRLDGGYNVLFSIDDGNGATGGLYVAGGVGFELFDKYIMELYTSRYEAKDNGNDITYKDIFFKVGYKFSL